ncbi:MAG: hypothetical protein AB3N10_19670 [Allomuricauda sp.]
MRKLIVILLLPIVAVIFFYGGYRYRNYEVAKGKVPNEEVLKEALKGANIVTIAFDVEKEGELEEEIFVITEVEVIEELIGLIEFEEERIPKVSFWKMDSNLLLEHCMCDGDYSLVFMGMPKSSVGISLHHLESLRWSEKGWAGDAPLKAGCGENMLKLIKKNWIPVGQYLDEHLPNQSLEVTELAGARPAPQL